MRVLQNSFKLIEKDADLPRSLRDYIAEEHKCICSELDEADDSDNVDYLIGGALYLCETDDDLEQIKGVYGHDIRVFLDEFDIAEYILEGEFVHFWLATNNSGGPTYFVPKAIAEKYESIAEMVKRHLIEEKLG